MGRYADQALVCLRQGEWVQKPCRRDTRQKSRWWGSVHVTWDMQVSVRKKHAAS